MNSFLIHESSYTHSAASEVIPLQPPSPPGSGILTITLRQALGLRLPDQGARSGSGDFTDPDVGKRWAPYAILAYDKFQVSAEAIGWGRRGSVVWDSERKPIKFDVSTSSELTLYLFVRNPDTSSGGSRVIPLGLIKLDPFLESWAPGLKWVDVQIGTGKIELGISYVAKKITPLDYRHVWRVLNEINSGDLVYVEKTDTSRSYAMATVHPVDFLIGTEMAILYHPFIAPIKFAFKSPEGLCLLSPLASGGNLFGHLQRERRFDNEKASLYAAELTLSLEYLHEEHIIATFKPETILIDSFGHISLCTPGIFGLKIRNGYRITPGTPEYPAPELLLGHKASQMVDWWTLGVILCEMLTGLLPFYHKDADEKQRKILGRDVQFPRGLPSAAMDFLTRLLDKDPSKRLGANGASEVKSHAFFHGTKWRELQRMTVAPFKPSGAVPTFKLKMVVAGQWVI